MTDAKEIKEKLLTILREEVTYEASLRQQLQIGDKFRFIRDRLAALLTNAEASLQTFIAAVEQPKDVLADDEQLVYVYLFNAQGITLQTWHKLVRQDVFYEYSVNRPIYGDKHHVESFVRAKTTRAQHAYMTIAIKKSEIHSMEHTKDAIGNPLLKIKDGSLKIERLFAFTHNDKDYVLNSRGELIKKET